MKLKIGVCTLAIFLAGLTAQAMDSPDDQLESAITAVKKVDINGQGHDAAVQAMKTLNAASAEQIPQLLSGMDDANKLATNWLRSAVLSIAQRDGKLPIEKIKSYFDDQSHGHFGRLLAFDLLAEANPDWGKSTVPKLVDDTSMPLRYKAIAELIEKSAEQDSAQSIATLSLAITKARDINQVIEIAKALDKQGVSINLQKQLGFQSSWHIVGNFNNKDESGFDLAYGPESNLKEIDLKAKYDDAEESDAQWQEFNSVDPTGLVDLNNIIGNIKGVTAYAYSTFDADEEREVEIRIGCINAHKVWVNGNLVISNEIYHNGISPDKFSGNTKLKKGENQILIKVCQNEQTQPWAQRWQFQLRVCDETGKAISVAKQSDEAN